MLKSPAIINSLLLFVKDATTEENSVVKAFICSFSILGGLYIFPMFNVFNKLPPFTFIINHCKEPALTSKMTLTFLNRSRD